MGVQRVNAGTSQHLSIEDDVAGDGVGGWPEPGAGRAAPDRPEQPSPRSAALRASAARIAGGLIFAAILWLLDLRLGAALVVVAVVVISLVSVVSPPIGSKIDSTIALVAVTGSGPSHAGWNEWEKLGGILTSAPGCTSWGAGRIDCFARGQDNAMWHKWFTN